MSAASRPATAFAVASLAIFFFSVMDGVMKGLVLALGTYAALLWRSFAGIALAGALHAALPSPWPTRATLRIHLARGAVSTVMGILFFWGLARVPMAQAIALAFIAPLIALYLAAVLLHESVGRRTITASLVAFAGVLLILAGEVRAGLGATTGLDREALLGSLAVLASALCYAVNLILMRLQSQAAGPVEAAFFQNLTVAALLIAALPLLGTSLPAPQHLPWLLVAALLSMVSLLLFSWAYARAEANYLAASEYGAFIWSALLGWLMFAERVAPHTIAGAALIVGGCIVTARGRPASAPAVEVAA